ncbi:hypothetical protein KUV59_08870 [Marinobacter daepoensis]|nr:hypothetical protein [Marinobacter daepoensis]
MVLTVTAGQPGRWQPTELVSMLLSSGARQVVSQWLRCNDFLDEQHHPRMLPSTPHDPDSFADLVEATNPDLVPGVVLGELLRKGIVESLDSGHVLLKRSAYAPRGDKGCNDYGSYDDFSDVDTLRRRHNDT